MARRPDDDDMTRIDIDDIFESDESDFELENEKVDDINVSDEDLKRFLIEDDEDVDEEDAVVVESAEQLSFGDVFSETEDPDGNDENEPEETTKTETPEVKETEEVETVEETKTEEIVNETTEVQEEIPHNKKPFNDDGTINEDFDEPMLEINDEEETKPETSEIVETPKVEKSESKPDETETEVIRPKTEEFEEVFDGAMDNSKSYSRCEDETDKRVVDGIVETFKDKVKSYYMKYHENDILNYIKDFIDSGENRRMFSDMYIMNYCKYSIAIDFKNEIAKQNLWVLTAGMFADEIEAAKHSGAIETTVETDDVQFDSSKIVEDKNVALVKAYKKTQQEKYAKYKLDRTIFNIVEGEDSNGSIFDDKRTLDRDFYESEFYSIHKEVMTSDKFADMSTVYSNVIINESSSYIPIIDYSSGVRVICIDTNDTDQYHLNPMIISKKVPFSYQINARNVKLRVLYLDDCKNRPMAVICSLKKLIGFDRIKSRYKIRLAHNYVIAYTTEARWIEMFEKGDPDTHSPENSTYFMSKPSNMCIGIMVLDKKTDRDKRSIRRNQIARDVGRYQPASADDYNIQFVISARISRNDLRLRNPSIPRENRYVEYVITQYNEANPVIISDGFQTLVSCIIKEHKANYDPGTPYSISYEYDRDGLVTPAVIKLLDERNGLEPAYGQRVNGFDIDSMFTLPPSRLKMGGVQDFEYGRLDKRYFTPSAIQRKYDRSLWSSYDLTTRDGRIQFIKSRGFDEFLHLRPLMFDVMPYALNMLESSDTFTEIIKVSPTMLADRNSQDSEAILFKQAELNYKKSLGDSTSGKMKLLLVEALDSIIDAIANKNK